MQSPTALPIAATMSMICCGAPDVAVQVEFERHVLKPGFHLIGARVETTWVPGALSAVGQGESTCPATPTPTATRRRPPCA
jgi:hypothetical protein